VGVVVMNLRRYDTYIVHYDIGDFIEEYENINGEHTNANDALNIITVQKNRIVELESEKQKLIELFENCRDSTGYSNEYFRGMYNGIEWARSCIEKDCPEYKDSVEKTVPIYVPTIAEMTEEK